MAYISTEEVKEIRKALKEEFGKDIKFSVRKQHHMKVCVTLKSGTYDFSKLIEASGWDYTSFMFPITKYEDEAKDDNYEVINKIIEIIKKAPANAEGGEEWFDKSDSMTDYFHTAFYFDVQIGDWERPYEYKG